MSQVPNEQCAAIAAAATRTSDGGLGLDWLRREAGVERRLRELKPQIINMGTSCFGESVFGASWYPSSRPIDGEEQLGANIEESAEQCQAMAERLIDSAKARAGWSVISNDGSLLILQKADVVDEPTCLCGRLEFSSAEETTHGTGITVDDVYQLLRNVENRTLFDSMVRDGCVLRRVKNAVLFYQVYAGMFGFSGRDFLLVGGEKILNEGKRIIIGAWTPDESRVLPNALRSMGVPRKCSGYVRGKVNMTAYDIQYEESGAVVLHLVIQVDMGSYIPHFLQLKVMSSMLQDMSHTKKWVLSHKDRKNKLAPSPDIIIRTNIFMTPREILDYYGKSQK